MYRMTSSSFLPQGIVPEVSAWAYNADDMTLSTREGRLVHFTRTQGSILESIFRCRGRTAPYNYICEFVWDDRHNSLDEGAEVKVMVHKLREILEAVEGIDFTICTTWGVGYRSTRLVNVIAIVGTVCPRCQRPFTLDEADRGDAYGSHSATQANRHGQEARGIDRRQVAGPEKGRPSPSPHKH